MVLLDLVCSFQVGNGAGYTADTVTASGGEHRVSHGHGHQTARCLRFLPIPCLEITVDLPPFQLDGPCLFDPMGDRGARLAFRPRVLSGLDPAHTDDQVESVDERAGDPGPIPSQDGWATVARPTAVAEISAGTRVGCGQELKRSGEIEGEATAGNGYDTFLQRLAQCVEMTARKLGQLV